MPGRLPPAGVTVEATAGVVVEIPPCTTSPIRPSPVALRPAHHGAMKASTTETLTHAFSAKHKHSTAQHTLTYSTTQHDAAQRSPAHHRAA